ncbi:AT-rich interactive domain-containing protein 2 [Sesamum alatum]|uniref:AT-rich interactive domain-containing protein 2 n=1 Tax=Sesamum alatum TaxID=300844 RepID=A0AAE1Y2K6_9LAMI|nr:AT-rich interactive domain-containing protein 2 [Sesamum alatum]
MEEWRELRVDEGDGNAKGNRGLGFDLDFELEKCRFDSCKERLRGVFDQVLVAFMSEKSGGKCIRPIPALCGDGRPVDLYKLFWVVRKIGGYDAVSRNNLWGFVLEECGLGLGLIPSVKLIYVKYLKELDQWLQQVFSKRDLVNGGLVQRLDLLSRELETRFRGVLPDGQEQGKQEKDSNFVEHAKDRANVLGSGDDHSRLSAGRVAENIICKVHGDVDSSIDDYFTESAKKVVRKAVNESNGFCKGEINDDGGKSCDEDSNNIVAAKKVIDKVINRLLNCGGTVAVAAVDDERFSVQDNNDLCVSAKKVVKKVISKTHDLSENTTDDKDRVGAEQSTDTATPTKSDVGNVLDSRKRKRQSHSFREMLNWLKDVAKRPNDPSLSIPECSKMSDYGNEEFFVQALLVREALLIRRPATNGGENLLKDQQKKPRMHPSMYEDDVPGHQSTEKLRCSKRVPSSTKSHLCPCCNSSSAAQSKDIVHQAAEAGNNPKTPAKLIITDVDEPPTNSNEHKSSDVPAEKQVSLGPLFQAEVPEWTGVRAESDSKWLGTRMWAPEDGEGNSMNQLVPIGKGRQQQCNCPFPGSVECVRFHIAEKRFKLKQELGLLFYRWRFDRMGEEVSLSWTEEEEKRFKDMMRSYAAFSNKFWNTASRFLPSKTREKLVSYYFNVFLIQRRSYQNRVTPKDVDSDDDEKECGSIGTSFGYRALYTPAPKLISCTLNEESTEFV